MADISNNIRQIDPPTNKNSSRSAEVVKEIRKFRLRGCLCLTLIIETTNHLNLKSSDGSDPVDEIYLKLLLFSKTLTDNLF